MLGKDIFFATFATPAFAALTTAVAAPAAAFATPVAAFAAPAAAFLIPVLAVVMAEFATFAAFVILAVVAPRILFFGAVLNKFFGVLLDKFFESEFRVLVGPLLKREIRLLFCGDTFFEVVGGEIDKLFFLLIAFDMVEAKLLISIVRG